MRWAFCPSQKEDNYLFDLVNKLSMYTSIIFTGNKGFGEWSDFSRENTIKVVIVDRLAPQYELFTMNEPNWRIEHRETILQRT
jgi:hypothetical protein